MMNYIDASVGLAEGMVIWPGDPAFEATRVKSIDEGDSCNVTALRMGAHTGTHVDAPLHFIRDGAGIDRAPLDTLIGPCMVIEIQDEVSIKRSELERKGIAKGDRILFKTVNSTRHWKAWRFVEEFVYIEPDAAKYLVENGVALVGIDYLSVGEFKNGLETHTTLLGNGIWIVEGLNLSGAAEGEYQLICLPLKIISCDGAPARVVVGR